MNKKTIFMLIITCIVETIVTINMIIFGIKADKISKQEESQQYTELGYYDYQIWINEERHVKYQNYSSTAGAPMLITNVILLGYWIPKVFKKEEQ